ncbi:MAG TPA: DUF3568 family protein [Lacunisphaera sp.]|nr:DUF3568 family protein [Lacunisphaera sp.]
MKTSQTPPDIRLALSLIAAALLASVAVHAGCMAVAAGAGAGAAVAYVRGDLDTTLGAGLEQSKRAVDLAIADLQFARISTQQDALVATYVTRTAADKKVELYLEKISDVATKLKIRAGTFGEDSLQNEILARIKAHL